MQNIVTQDNAPSWGLPRISHRENKGQTAYLYPDSAGKGVLAYVIDTGINVEHKEFGGRATFGANMVGGENVDDNGHGTHVAGTIAGSTFGLAKKADLVAVKVLGGSSGSGTNSGVMKGIEWAINDARSKGKSRHCVANMSLGGGFSAALNKVVKTATNSGLTFVVAAGNDGVDASGSSPASSPSAITVAASTKDDKKPEYVDLYPRHINLMNYFLT